MRKFLRSFLLLTLVGLAWVPGRAVAANYSLQLTNNTGLNPTQYGVYVMGFSVASSQALGATGTFVTQSSGTVSSYPVGTGVGQISTITMDAGTTFTGGRFYFFIVPVGQPAPSVTFGSQPTNPPDSAFPPYTIVEMTVPAPNQNATVDVQTVDGFVFPLTVGLNNGTSNASANTIFGQPVYTTGQTATVNRADIFTAYTSFMQAAATAGAPYLDLVYSPNSLGAQAGGILNPGAYLTTTDASNQYVNLGSSLNTAFNADLTTLFATTTLKIQGTASGAGESGPVIPVDTYSVTSTGNQTYPGTSVSLPALTFTGDTNPGNVFHVFNPVGIAVLTNDAGVAITGTVNGTSLTLAAPASAVSVGMYVAGAGLTTSNGQALTTITAINGNVLTLSVNAGTPTPGSQYQFSKLPYLVMFQTPGQMVLANSGVFADSTIQYAAGSSAATVAGAIENYIVAALNRGVGAVPAALNPSPATAGATSAYWGTATNWYPAGTTQNLFSLFMHTGSIGGVPIFLQPYQAQMNARGQTMGSAYGFGYDENGGPQPAAPAGAEVPSKFDGTVPPGASIQITLGPWVSSASPTPTPVPAPTLKVDGKKTITTSAKTVKFKGTAKAVKVFIKYKNASKKTVTKHTGVKANGSWIFKFQPKLKTTHLQFYAENSVGERTSVKKIKVVRKDG